MIWLNLVVALSLALIAYQDFKSRQIMWVLLPILALAGGAVHNLHATWIMFGWHIAINLAVVLIVLFILFLYAKFKLMRPFLRDVFGLGDVLFLIAFAFLFPTISFLNFFVFSLLFSLIISLFLRYKQATPYIPLAGLMSIFLLIVYTSHWLGVAPNIYQM